MSDGNKERTWLDPRGWFRPFVEEPIQESDFQIKSDKLWSWTVLFLIFNSLTGFFNSLFEIVQYGAPCAIASLVLWSCAIVYLAVFRPRTGSLPLVGLYIGVFICHAVSLAQSQAGRYVMQSATDVASAFTAIVTLVSVLNLPLRDPARSSEDICPAFSPPTKELRTPEDNLTGWQWMTVSWLKPLIKIGCKRQLNDEDVWFLGYEFQHTHLHDAFRNLTGTVVWRLIKANYIDLVILTLLEFIELAAMLSSPIILQQLLQVMEHMGQSKKPAIIFALLLLAVRCINAQSAVFSMWFSRRAYERSRGEMITMLHEKVLSRKILAGAPRPDDDSKSDGMGHNGKTPGAENDSDDAEQDLETTGLLSGVAQNKTKWRSTIRRVWSKITWFIPQKQKQNKKLPADMGKILNLMRNDVYETAQRFWEYQRLLQRPLGTIFSIVLVWRLLGWPCLVGVAVVVVAQLLNYVLARALISWETVRRRATDEKLQQISQYVEAIRHLRWYGWHLHTLQDVMSARQKELNLRMVTYLWQNAIKFVNAFSSAILPVAAFWAYTTLAGQSLTVDVAFPALQLFSMVQQNLRELPELITVLLNASVAVGRIEDFMAEPDVTDQSTIEMDDRLEASKASFAWPGTETSALINISLEFPPGLTIVFGPVASGKSALLQALLGELDHKDGRLVRPDAAMAYCAQSPWLQSMTIRENILFGSPYDELRYKMVIDACALLPDFASFQQGDLSPIGENGIGLSGGQKARVALARAIYSPAKFVLLDDPLSALDQQTAEWIVAKCFRTELLLDRTVILVTHRTDLCKDLAVQMVEMDSGIATSRMQTPVHGDNALELVQTQSSPEQIREAQESAAIPDKFEDEEHRAHGGVQLAVYWEYVKAGKIYWWFLVVLSTIVWRFFDYSASWLIKEWGEAYKTASTSIILLAQNIEYHVYAADHSTPLSRFFDKFPDPSVDVKPWLRGLLILVILQSVTFMVSQLLMVVITYKAGKKMFADIMRRISDAKFRFYDVTPIGRLMNRLTGDVGTVDGQITGQFLNIVWFAVSWLSSLVVFASVTPVFLIFSVALTASFVYIFNKFLPSSQSLRRLEMVSLSPLMSNFGALLSGLTTVRAFHAQKQFQDRVITVTDAFQKMDHFYWSLQIWLMYRLDSLSAVSTFILTILAIYSGLSPGLTAFILTAAQRFVNSTHTLCREYGSLQLNFVSVERVVELLHLDVEDPGTLDPPASWPSNSGDIIFEDVTIRYAPDLEPAIKNVSLTIPGTKNTAIIGRTGSGKSTLALSLLATIPIETGRILIDGIDISQVSKQTLRSRITFLAQEPILFPGTLRTNLDPLSEHSDLECSQVLLRIGAEKFDWTLTTSVEKGGENLSQGQRQLVGLARAILRRSNIVIMDEATASIDFDTAWEVQRVLKEELKGATVVTIAHRASVVHDAGWVVQLEKGALRQAGLPGEVAEQVVNGRA